MVSEAESEFVYRKGFFFGAFLFNLVLFKLVPKAFLAFKKCDLICDVIPVIPRNSMQTAEVIILTLN